jgi:50S ribosomal protein L16 3-hydroxylase
MPDNRLKTSDIDCSRIFSGNISLEDFLRDYWQQKPLLIRNAFPEFTSPLTAEELAGLACEDDVNARIVIEKDAERPWSVIYGPFDEDDFAQLPEDHWTLLVSDVEKHVPQAREIKDCFRFIPDWRMDDLMFSYAPEGGSVGPHLDAYDVFLLQAAGRRNWMISETHANKFIEDIDLSILANFTPDESWILEPGDMLYLPPGIAHHGVATEPCLTCSIGFRAPSVRAMISEFAENIANNLSKELRYEDPGLELQVRSSEITPSAHKKIKQLLEEHLTIDDHQVRSWFGKYMTAARSGTQAIEPETGILNYTQFEALLKDNTYLCHSPASRFLFSREENNAILFVDGCSYSTSLIFSEIISQHRILSSAKLLNTSITTQDQETLVELYNLGCLYFSNERE